MIQTEVENINGTGILGSLRRFGETVVAIVHNRLELAALELQEEKSRAISMLIWAAVLIFFGFMMMVALTLTVIFVFWEHRTLVAGVFAGFYLLAALVAFLAMRKNLKNPPIPFAETISQFKKDREWFETLR